LAVDVLLKINLHVYLRSMDDTGGYEFVCVYVQ
jgi:hypothetical protein